MLTTPMGIMETLNQRKHWIKPESLTKAIYKGFPLYFLHKGMKRIRPSTILKRRIHHRDTTATRAQTNSKPLPWYLPQTTSKMHQWRYAYGGFDVPFLNTSITTTPTEPHTPYTH